MSRKGRVVMCAGVGMGMAFVAGEVESDIRRGAATRFLMQVALEQFSPPASAQQRETSATLGAELTGALRDLRALIELGRRLAESAEGSTSILYRGLTQREFAKLIGVDHRSLGKHNRIEIPTTGPAPTLPPGKVPARRIGTTLRYFAVDLFGAPGEKGLRHAPDEEAPPGFDDERDWRRSLRLLRDS